MTDLMTKARDRRRSALKTRAVLDRNIFAETRQERRSVSSKTAEPVPLLAA